MHPTTLAGLLLLALPPQLTMLTSRTNPPRRLISCTDVSSVPRTEILAKWKLQIPRTSVDSDIFCEPIGVDADGEPVCDWEFEIADKAVLRPVSGMLLRVVSTFRSHIHGSGSWQTFNVFECRSRKLRTVFSTGEMFNGGHFDRLSENSFAITRGYWLRADAECCPSHERRTEYAWRSSARRFVAIRTTYFKFDQYTSDRTEVPKPPGDDYRNHSLGVVR